MYCWACSFLDNPIDGVCPPKCADDDDFTFDDDFRFEDNDDQLGNPTSEDNDDNDGAKNNAAFLGGAIFGMVVVMITACFTIYRTRNRHPDHPNLVHMDIKAEYDILMREHNLAANPSQPQAQ